MCRFYSGPFALHPLLAEWASPFHLPPTALFSSRLPGPLRPRRYDWYWRLEPSVKFFCRLSYEWVPQSSCLVSTTAANSLSLDLSPFRFLAQNNKLYGFNIAGELCILASARSSSNSASALKSTSSLHYPSAVVERPETVPTLFPTIAAYRKDLLASGELQPTDFCASRRDPLLASAQLSFSRFSRTSSSYSRAYV